MQEIKFSYNWNNKLKCSCFTTIRVHHPAKYSIGKQYVIKYKEENLGVATIVDIKTFPMSKLNNFMCYIDTGYSPEETKNMLCKMHQVSISDNLIIDFILLKYN
jgi:hypothetical protein